MMNDQIQTRLIYNKEKITYSNLSEVFEINFNKISRLVPLLPSVKVDLIGIKKPSNNLYLICHEKSKYTGTYTLTHKINSSTKVINRPDICFKIYFDAKLLEVVSICKETRINSYHPFINDCSDLSFQLELNVFMLRWLDYCLDRYNGAEWVARK
ncbi:MAG: DUF1249 domain-containing protein [Candidatus Pseudothioglobus sp.]